MAIVLDANMKLFAERMNITSSRMIQDYGLKTVDEIIEAEAAQGNMKAINYAREMYHSPEKLIKIFKLADIENKFVILHKMDDSTRMKVLPLLKEEDLVMGLYFFTQDALLEMLQNVDMEELVNVMLNAFPLPEMINMFNEEDFAFFFQNKDTDRNLIMEQMKLLPPDVMIHFVESMTGEAYKEENAQNLFSMMDKLPDDKFGEFMSLIDLDVQKQLTFQMSKEDPKCLELFPPEAYLRMLSTLQKPDMVKPMIGLQKESLVAMIERLPDDLMAIVGAQIDTKEFAKFLLDGHLEVLQKAMMI